MTDTKLEQLCSLLSSGELRVQAIAAVVVWTFAQQKHTLLRSSLSRRHSQSVTKLWSLLTAKEWPSW